MPPRKKPTPAAGTADEAGAHSAGVKRNLGLETTVLLQWLSNLDNRNIVTGAAGVGATHMSLLWFSTLCRRCSEQWRHGVEQACCFQRYWVRHAC